MSRRSDGLATLDRLIRVRRVQAQLAMAALGRTQVRSQSEAALLARVSVLLGGGGAAAGVVAADAANARAAADAVLGRLAGDIGLRLSETRAEQARLAAALGRARAAVDAAVARRTEKAGEA